MDRFMKKAAIVILRLALVAMALAMLGVCYGVGWVVIFDGGFGAKHRGLDVLLFAVTYAAAVPYFITLFQSAKLLGLLGRRQAFSDRSAQALSVIIKSTLAVFAVCTLGGLPFFYQIAIIEDAPGVMVIGLVIAGVALMITVFAHVLRTLLQEAMGLMKPPTNQH